MYDLFDLEGRDFKIKGYHFPCENPKKVVVLIHGIGEHDGRYQHVAERFNEAGIAMVGMDLRGHGRTDGVRGDAFPRAEIFGDIDALIEYAMKLYPGVPVIMYGHSMGGNIVCDYRARGAKNDIMEKYLISAPWIRLVKPITGVLLKAVTLLSKIAPKAKINSNCDESDLGNLSCVKPYKDDPMVHPYITLRTAVQGFTIGGSLENGVNERNGRTDNIPTLVMHGTCDKICDIKGTESYIAHAKERKENIEFIPWEGYYHEIHNGGKDIPNGEAVISKMIEFILA